MDDLLLPNPPVVIVRTTAGSHCAVQMKPIDPTFSDPEAFCNCASILGFGQGGMLAVNLLNYGKIKVMEDGIDIGDPLLGTPKHIPLSAGCYTLLGFVPIQKSHWDWPRHFLLQRTDTPGLHVHWDGKIVDCSDSRIMGVLRGGIWDGLMGKIEADDMNHWNSMVDLALGEPVGVWSQLGYHFNRQTPGDGVILGISSAVGSFWTGYDESGKIVAVLMHWW